MANNDDVRHQISEFGLSPELLEAQMMRSLAHVDVATAGLTICEQTLRLLGRDLLANETRARLADLTDLQSLVEYELCAVRNGLQQTQALLGE
jgi:hypothetical protein